MRVKLVALIGELILLCLPAATCANAMGTTFAGAGKGSTLSASIARKGLGNHAVLIVAGTAASSNLEPSAGLLLLIGLGLIAGASFIGKKMPHSSPVDQAEDSEETTGQAWSFYGLRAPTIGRLATVPKRGMSGIEGIRTEPMWRLSSKPNR